MEAIISANGATMLSAASSGESLNTTIRTPASGRGSRLKWSAKGSSPNSVVVIRSTDSCGNTSITIVPSIPTGRFYTRSQRQF
jgi:hypothetical protein